MLTDNKIGQVTELMGMIKMPEMIKLFNLLKLLKLIKFRNKLGLSCAKLRASLNLSVLAVFI